MKRILALLLAAVIFATIAVPANAVEQPQAISSTEMQLENGLTVIDEIVSSQSRATNKSASRKWTIKDGDTVIAVIMIEAIFRYDGSTVSVVSKSVTQADTYEGWSYKQKSFTSSGGTVTLEAKLTKLLIFNQSITMTLSCDKDGNISA